VKLLVAIIIIVAVVVLFNAVYGLSTFKGVSPVRLNRATFPGYTGPPAGAAAISATPGETH
jgi:hypothetical protein